MDEISTVGLFCPVGERLKFGHLLHYSYIIAHLYIYINIQIEQYIHMDIGEFAHWYIDMDIV